MSYPVATGAQMRKIDHTAIEDRGIPGLKLMEHAGTGVARAIRKYFGPLGDKSLAIVCGKGNNGGDGYVIARLLAKECEKISVIVLADESQIKGDALGNYRRVKEMELPVFNISKISELKEKAAPLLNESHIIVDAILGTGITGSAKGLYGEAIELVNSLGKNVVAVDIASGLLSDTGKVEGPAVYADLTVTFALGKIAHYVYPAATYTGELEIIDIGIPADVIDGMHFDVRALDENDIDILLPERKEDSHKGTYGHAIIIGGSPGKSGAVIMAAQAAQRSGAGLVSVVAPSSVNSALEASLLEAMTFPVESNNSGSISSKSIGAIIEFCKGKSVVVAGPGMGWSRDTYEIIKALLENIEIPLILDADALNVLAEDLSILEKRRCELVLTPHPGEMGRIAGISSSQVQEQRLEVSVEIAKRYECTVLLKGSNTVISYKGKRTYINLTGNPGMATGGSGDVLTGIIAGLSSQGISAEYSASAGAFIHGLSGDIASEDMGEISLCAGDIIDYIPDALGECFFVQQ